ncbi:MAG: S41 family peptidase [Bacteroidaceae bacterium]|nr:S41 family peptidase [Bacteroidaceae bacterium]
MKRITPILVTAICILLGYFIGSKSTVSQIEKRVEKQIVKQIEEHIAVNNDNKLCEVLTLVNGLYVDDIDMDTLIEKSIPKVLTELDPHSVYIPIDEVEAINSELESSFSGIGIRFTIQEDTINISDVIRGGPSEMVGILAGDRIIKVNDTLFVGKDICTNDNAMKKLKGPKGSFVKLAIQRYGEPDLLDFVIRRDQVPVESIEAYYLIDQKWGYIQVERFAENTYTEFIQAMIQLAYNNAQGFIIDLRGNGGGYLGIALEIANQFLEKGDIIVYTEGSHSNKSIERANGYGMFKGTPLIILIDETSASASEIIAGTIQDNDRGIVIGRRSFGKGLVQQQIPLSDNSLIRLTISRYHTPSGRCIQKPYNKGDRNDYDMDILERYNRGEFFSQDSIHQNEELIYKTKKGRTVYGGGGIMPDIFVASDTTNITAFASEIFSRGLISQFALRYINENRHNLKQCNEYKTLVEQLEQRQLYRKFIEFAASKGHKASNADIESSKELIKRSLYSNSIYQLLGMCEHIKYINLNDQTVLKAIEVLERGEAFP